MSPYKTTPVKLVERFAITPARKEILDGYLRHRAALLAFGITGFQWLDGSFLEDIESLEGRDPRDIDVVTFAVRPALFAENQAAWDALLTDNKQVFDPRGSKAAFRTDAYFVDLKFNPQILIKQAAYWFGLFSHRRVTSLWKGMLEILLLAGPDDETAIHLLRNR